jgi:hypothetical protein
VDLVRTGKLIELRVAAMRGSVLHIAGNWKLM